MSLQGAHARDRALLLRAERVRVPYGLSIGGSHPRACIHSTERGGVTGAREGPPRPRRCPPCHTPRAAAAAAGGGRDGPSVDVTRPIAMAAARLPPFAVAAAARRAKPASAPTPLAVTLPRSACIRWAQSRVGVVVGMVSWSHGRAAGYG